MAYLWFALTCFFAWRVWLYRKTLQEATDVVNELESSNNKLLEEAQLKQEEMQRLNDQVLALRQEQHQSEVRYKETQQTISILAKQWENLQLKYEQNQNQLHTARSEAERYKNLALNAERDAQATIAEFKVEFEERWQEADEHIKNAEEEAQRIIQAAQAQAKQITTETTALKQEQHELQQALETLQDEIERLRETLATERPSPPPVGGSLIKAITKQLNDQTKQAPDTQRPSAVEAPASTDETNLESLDFLTPHLPAAGIAKRSSTIVRTPTYKTLKNTALNSKSDNQSNKPTIATKSKQPKQTIANK